MTRKIDVSTLRDEAAKLIERGKLDKAIEVLGQLETAEPANPNWSKRLGETHRRAGNDAAAIVAFERAAENYALAGFLVQAIAVCKLILQIDPQHSATQQRLAGWLPKPAPRPEPAKPETPAPAVAKVAAQHAVLRAPAAVARPPAPPEAERPRPPSEQRLPKPVPRADDIDPETIPRSGPLPVVHVDTQRDTDVPRASDEKRRSAIAMPPATDPPPTEDFEIELAKPTPAPKPRQLNRLAISELPIPIDDRPIEISGSARKLGTSERSIEMELPDSRLQARRPKEESLQIPIDVQPMARGRSREPSLEIPIDIEAPRSGFP